MLIRYFWIMRFRQNSILTLFLLIIVVHFFYTRHTTHQHQPFSDRIQVHIAPDYTNEDVIKPANGLSVFFNIVQIASSTKKLLQVEIFQAVIYSKDTAHSRREIPIFLSYRVFRIWWLKFIQLNSIINY